MLFPRSRPLLLSVLVLLLGSSLVQAEYQTIADKMKARNQRAPRERSRRPPPRQELKRAPEEKNAIEEMRRRLRESKDPDHQTRTSAPESTREEATGYQTIEEKMRARNQRRQEARRRSAPPPRRVEPRRQPPPERDEGSYLNIADRIKAKKRRTRERRSEPPAPRRNEERSQPSYEELLEWWRKEHPETRQPTPPPPHEPEPEMRRRPEPRRGVPRDGEEDPSEKLKRLLQAKQKENRWAR